VGRDIFANNQSAGGTIVPASGALTHQAGPAQFGRVDILTSGAGAFDTGAGVLANYFIGADTPPNPNPFTSYLFDITALVGGGGTFQDLRLVPSSTCQIVNRRICQIFGRR